MTTYCTGHHKHNHRCNYGGPMQKARDAGYRPATDEEIDDMLKEVMNDYISGMLTRAFEDQAPPHIARALKAARARS